MNEHERADRFNREVDRVVTRGEHAESTPMPSQEQAALEIALRLLQTDFSPESHIQRDLRQRLLQKAHLDRKEQTMPSLTGEWKRPVLAVALGLALLLAAFAVPQTQAVAREVIRSLFVRMPTDVAGSVEVPHPQASLAPTAEAPVAPGQPSIARVQAMASFPVRAPSTLPPGYRMLSAGYEPDVAVASFVYERDGVLIYVTQMPTSSPNFMAQSEKIGAGAQLETVHIGKLTGAFVQGDWDTKDGVVVWNADYPYMRLRWVDGGVYYEVATERGQQSGLTKADLLVLAQSMR